MTWKYLEQNILFPKGLNWEQIELAELSNCLFYRKTLFKNTHFSDAED